MSLIPDGLMYTKTHEWFKVSGTEVIVGITDYAQHQLTDIVYVDLPKAGTVKKAGEVLLTVESVKSAEDVYSPVDGTVKESNPALADKPEQLNQDPYASWMVKIRVSEGYKPKGMTPAEYRKHIGE
ncbi:MAG: glycine cleavage system protein GcvH [Candidatus Thermoplasmatota archaeon]|jgi:glycine cleavage system H protein|nr:glycine cleavage system protein GcvH [Candidatus Thermoplasmatota archaeon]MCL5793877.1 glycine cleavage system protein GcvH [Candidatus Thermoplasmatota archaeon]